MQLLNNTASIRVVENTKVTCKKCILSEVSKVEKCVFCQLTGAIKADSSFCKDGLWLYEGEVLEFKETLARVYNKVDSDKDLAKE